METTVRPAIAADAAMLADLLVQVGFWPTFNAQASAEREAQVSTLLSADLRDSSHSVYIAVDASGMVQGYSAVHWLPCLFLPGPEGYISELFVRPEGRGQGIGGRLLEAVEAEALARGCARLSLLNNRTRESYARDFYPKHGWDERTPMANFVKRLK